MEIRPIAYFRSPFQSKFGIPKQSGLVSKLEGKIEFCQEFCHPDAIRGIQDFDFIWLIWGFSANPHSSSGLLVRPPLLGGNTKMGVFATRSPFRPNPLGLSSVKISRIAVEENKNPVIYVSGADLMDGTPIYDIKPYVTYADCHPEAKSGFVDQNPIQRLDVVIPEHIRSLMGRHDAEVLSEVLALDPRPHYHEDPEKIYGMPYHGYDIHFKVSFDRILTVTDVEYISPNRAEKVKR